LLPQTEQMDLLPPWNKQFKVYVNGGSRFTVHSVLATQTEYNVTSYCWSWWICCDTKTTLYHDTGKSNVAA